MLELYAVPDNSIGAVKAPLENVVTEPPSESAATGMASNSVGTSSRIAMLKAFFFDAVSERLDAVTVSPGRPTNRLPHVACADMTY
jgi:hypothetical protein